MLKTSITTFCLWAVFFISFTKLNANDIEDLQIFTESENSVLLEWHAPEVIFERSYVSGKSYDVPRMGDLLLSQEPGHPMVPMASLLFEIPHSAKINLTVLDTLYSTPENHILCPAPRIEYRDIDSENIEQILIYEPDAAIYSSDAFFPRNITSFEEGKIRGKRMMRVVLYPLLFNPVRQQTRVLRYFRGRLTWSLSEAAAPTRGKRKIEKAPFDRIISKILDGQPVSSSVGEQRLQQSTSDALLISKYEWYNPEQTQVKLYVGADGVYRVSGSELNNIGVNLTDIDPTTLRLLNKGQDVHFHVSDENGIFDLEDYILFYGSRRTGDSTFYSAYSDTNVYWLTWGGSPNVRFREKPASPNSQIEVDQYRHHLHIEEDNDYYEGDTDNAIHESEMVPGEGWIWRVFYPNDHLIIKFDAADFIKGEASINLGVRLRGTTFDTQNPDHHACFALNDSVIGDVYFNDREEVIWQGSAPSSKIISTGNRLEIRSLGDTGAGLDQFYLDWVEIDYLRKLHAINGFLYAELTASGDIVNIAASGFQSDSITVFNLSRENILTNAEISQRWKAELKVKSAGYSDGNLAHFFINGEYVFFGKRGHNLVVLDPQSGAVLDQAHFDTYVSATEADSMAAFVESLPDSVIVMVAIRDEGSARMTEKGYAAMEALGSELTRQVGSRDSWAMIGRKGATPWTVPEVHKVQGSGAAIIAQSMVFPQGGDSYSVIFQDSLSEENRFAIFEPLGIKEPRMAIDEPSSLSSQSNGADYLIITHKNFKQAAERLAAYRQNHNGYRTIIATVEDIYDEFNFGLSHPAAIHDFVQYSYQNWQSPAPSFLVLFGDASWDPKGNQKDAVKKDYVPSFGNPVSDNWFACLDGPDDILPDLFVGRIPVETLEQAEAYVSKIIYYESSPSAAWKKRFLFITGGVDDIEQSMFGRQSANLINSYVKPPPVSGEAITLNKTSDGLFEGEHREEIHSTLNNGVVWVNFIGHAGSRTWDLMFHNPDIDQLRNGERLPFITSMTCHTARFAEPQHNSFGENFTLAEEKGAIAFWGTSGWGYTTVDYSLLQQLFPAALVDTMQVLGEATTAAKLGLWKHSGTSSLNRHVIQQYTLLGDPAVDLALPEKPDLTLGPGDISILPEIPTEADSTASIKVRVHNFGLATPDSVPVDVWATSESQTRFQIDSTHWLPPIGLIDSVSFNWPLADMAGSFEIEAIVDNENFIDEDDERNNAAAIPVNVFSTQISVSGPSDFSLIPQNEVKIRVNNPSFLPDTEPVYEFELDTTNTFNSAALVQSGAVQQEILTTAWSVTNLMFDQTYFWRCKIRGDGKESAWTGASFRTSNNPQSCGWWQGDHRQFVQDYLSNLDVSSSGVSLANLELKLSAESAGYSDGNFARLLVNTILHLEPGRGHNLAVVDQNSGEKLLTRSFDTYKYSSEADSMAQLIESVDTGRYVLAAIKDEGSVSMTERAFAALESIGSAKCRDVGPRDSWAIIGVKGAEIGSVAEAHSPSGTGTAVASDTLHIRTTEGTLTSTTIGPAAKWNSLSWQSDMSAFGTNITISVLGWNKSTAQFDTLKRGLTDESDLAEINAFHHPKLKLLAHFSGTGSQSTPTLKSWQVTYDPVPDLAIGPQVVSVSADSVLEGEEVILSVDVYNVGQAPADSFTVSFEYSDPTAGRVTFATVKVPSKVPADSSVHLSQVWQSAGKAGRRQLTVRVDPEDAINELHETNNIFTTFVFVGRDTLGPEIEVKFDGQHIQYGDYVSSHPHIVARIRDNSPLAIDDTSQVHVLLDGERVPFSDNESVLRLFTESEDANVRGLIDFRPVLADGDHTLELFVKDASSNLASPYRIEFQVLSKLRLLNVMNYPNPFFGSTTFTFEITQPAEVMIKLYTVAGRLIKVIDAGAIAAGFQQVPWNGLDADGDPLANGVYIYKVFAKDGDDKTDETSKIVVMR